MKIGIFGGSFDPPHIEHINLVKSAVDSLGLDKIIIMPAYVPPHKQGKVLTKEEDRLKMCELAFSDCKNAVVSDYEIKKGGTSYTYLTCRYFKGLYPEAKIYWLVGTDMLRNFPYWKNPEDILKNVTLAVCARNEEEGWEKSEQENFINRFGTTFERINYNGKKVSSTQLRVLLSAGKDVTDFMNKDVFAYIKEHGLYEISGVKEALNLEKESRREHSIRVAELAAERSSDLGIEEKKAITAALFHDCAKYVSLDSRMLEGFECNEKVPDAVMHQYTGAYLAENRFGIKDEDILNSIRYHTSGRENMSKLEKLIFLSDMLESGRVFPGVDFLREKFWKEKNNIDECLYYALKGTLEHLEKTGGDIYPLTKKAYEYIAHQINK